MTRLSNHARAEHWDAVFQSKREEDVSWHEAVPLVSLRLMEMAGMTSDTCVVDVGGGNSRLIDHLLARGLHCLTVVDVSRIALDSARQCLGRLASVPRWI